MSAAGIDSPLSQRRAGVLLHPSSLPGPQRQGDIGEQARNFLHFMQDCGLSVWQMLPLGPTHLDRSPYQCLSAHAGNTELVSLPWLVDQGWLKKSELLPVLQNSNQALLEKAAHRFFNDADQTWQHRYHEFTRKHAHWLDDYALFLALKKVYHGKPWTKWPLCYRFRDQDSLDEAIQQNAEFMRSVRFAQFVFFTQWHELRGYAQQLNIKLFGDMPIYVALDSADVWARKENFLMLPNGRCQFVAGVPPDAFSEQGQLWGNPLYNWEYQEQHEFAWWVERFASQFELFDLVRIDHFRGLEACWQIPANADTAIDGEWVTTPGAALLERLNQAFDHLPLVAEDLGLITTEVIELRDRFGLPGMAVLQFAFDAQLDNLYLPYQHRRNSVVYTGTHDNDTSLGWYQNLPDYAVRHLHDYLGQSEFQPLNMPWELNRMALASVANLAIIPMQDLLGLNSTHRMNTPGTTEDNWSWRFDWSQVWPQLADDLRQLISLYGRSVSDQTRGKT